MEAAGAGQIKSPSLVTEGVRILQEGTTGGSFWAIQAVVASSVGEGALVELAGITRVSSTDLVDTFAAGMIR
jgi:hypothetical protein